MGHDDDGEEDIVDELFPTAVVEDFPRVSGQQTATITLCSHAGEGTFGCVPALLMSPRAARLAPPLSPPMTLPTMARVGIA